MIVHKHWWPNNSHQGGSLKSICNQNVFFIGVTRRQGYFVNIWPIKVLTFYPKTKNSNFAKYQKRPKYLATLSLIYSSNSSSKQSFALLIPEGRNHFRVKKAKFFGIFSVLIVQKLKQLLSRILVRADAPEALDSSGQAEGTSGFIDDQKDDRVNVVDVDSRRDVVDADVVVRRENGR